MATKTTVAALILLLCAGALAGCATAESGALDTEPYPVLKEIYAPYFLMGAAINGYNKETAAINHAGMSAILKEQFNSTTLSNLMKPSYLLKQNRCRASTDGMPAVDFSDSEECLRFCRDNGIAVRGHTLVWHDQTPRWFFCEDYDETKPYVTKAVMTQRMESYIRQALEYVQTNYPGVVYCWDVVNECVADNAAAADNSRGWSCRTVFNKQPTHWYTVMGPDYVYKAFEFARKYAAPGVALIYNDYNVYVPAKRASIYELARQLKEMNLIDGLGLQPTVGLDYPKKLSGTGTDDSFENCLRYYSTLGLEIQITELGFLIDEKKTGRNYRSLQLQADRYGEMINLLLKMDTDNGGPCNITGVTVFGICDDYPLYKNHVQCIYLWDRDCNPKDCFYSYCCGF